LSFRKLPSAKQLLLGMLGSDLLGVHTRTYGDNFLQACTELTGEIVAPGQVIHGSNVTRVTDFPMGIDYDRFMRARELSAVQAAYQQHRQKYTGMKVILTVDRLDPTKGLAERLEAYREFLRRSPDIHGRVIMVMLAVPSRTEIDEYKQLRHKVEKLVQAIIDEFGTPSWQPIDYMYTSLPVEAVTALYQVADVAFITPLRDGMNLVAKEYIASRPKNDGVLILSNTAGAAQELTDAILVDPRSRESLVAALLEAVKMPKHELKRRVAAMQDNVATNTVQYWASNFMNSLQKPLPGTRRLTWTLTPQHSHDVVDSFRRALHPIILLDYDGVLAPHIMNPLRAKPSHNLIKLLEKLGQLDKLDMAIISGRDKDELTDWLGDLPISLVAEHGAMMRSYTRQRGSSKQPSATWQRLTHVSPAWQDELQPILEKYAANTPGAHVEVKNFSLVWHYRRASPYYAQKHLVILRRILRPLVKTYNLGMYNGDKILEVKPLDINKGTAVTELLEQFSKNGAAPDFILCIGDDYTDEDMFETLPASAYTIKVGRLRTAARFRVRSADQVYNLLKKLAK
jgi:trehalose 6-phosphate synthase/phosphatase